jgi:hypothetical protein
MGESKQLFSFSQPPSFKLVANHGEKVFYGIVFIGVLSTYQDLRGQFLIDVIILVSILFTILFMVAKFLSKVIWRFDVNFDSRKVSFYLCRSTSPIYINFTEINQIKVNGVIIFFIKDKKLFYSTKQYIEVLKILNRVRNITWGKMCDILGPNKSIRQVFDRERGCEEKKK